LTTSERALPVIDPWAPAGTARHTLWQPDPVAIGTACGNCRLSARHASCLKGGMATHRASSAGIALGLFGLLAAFAGCSGSVTNPDGCSYNGKAYQVGDKFPASDGCNSCSCGERGEVQCTLIGCGPGPGPGPDPDAGPYCSVGGKRYAPGQQVSNDGCNTCVCTSPGEVACTARDCQEPVSSCDSLLNELQGTLSSVQKCSTAADCGQAIPGSSCGCTRDLVARKDASLGPYLELRAKVAELGCATDGGSTCDCPNADGFACVNNVCGWNYAVPDPQPDPVCEPYEPAELCVRGKPTADGESILDGDPLQVTVRSAGCLSSSCSKVIQASCTIGSGTAFDVKANFCVANTAKPGQPCTADCGTAHADCSFGQPLTAGYHQVKLGSIGIGFQVPSMLPAGGLCAGTR
jgi:pacifastin inhibitor LCMII